MIFLSIDTSTKYSVVALSSENGFRAGARRLFKKRRSDGLFLLMDQVLKKAKCKMGDVDFFACGVGPGSFTGLRIGLSTIKGLSYALKKPCLVFSSLDAIAFNHLSCRKPHLCVIVDARRSNVYSRLYEMDQKDRKGPGNLRRASEDLLLSLSSLLKKARRDTAFCGDALAVYKKEIKDAVPGSRFTVQESWYPEPESIALLTQESFRMGKRVDCFTLAPTYLYEQDCQVNSLVSKRINP